MPDYQQGKIYKIEVDGLTYYGSTTLTLKIRMWRHKSNFKRWKNGFGSNCRSFTLFDRYGFENCPIQLVEDYSCETKKELDIREDWYLKNMACINELAAHTTREEVFEQKRQWRQDHKEKLKEQRRQRYQDHKEEVKEQSRQYREDNKEVIQEQRQQHYIDNKEVIREKKREKIVCECGRTICKSVIAGHRRTTIHLAKLKSNPILNVIPNQHRWNAAV